MPPPPKRHPLDKHVSKNWRPPTSPAGQKPGMLFSDRLWHWLVALGGISVAAGGLAVCAFAHLGKVGGLLIGAGLAIFILAGPSQAQRNGYRE